MNRATLKQHLRREGVRERLLDGDDGSLGIIEMDDGSLAIQAHRPGPGASPFYENVNGVEVLVQVEGGFLPPVPLSVGRVAPVGEAAPTPRRSDRLRAQRASDATAAVRDDTGRG